MTATAKFAVGDVIRANEYYPNNTLLYRGNLVQVTSVDTSGRYAKYDGVVLPGEAGNTDLFGRTVENLTGSKFDAVDPELAPKLPKGYADLATKDDLARQVVAVAKRYKKTHGLCDVVDSALTEMGLGDFMTVTKTVTIEVEVPATASDEDVLKAATENLDVAEIG